MNKYLKIMFGCSLIIFLFIIPNYKEALADSNTYSTNINLDKRDSQIAFDFYMPKDGKIKLNVNVKDRGTVPGTLTFAIQTGYSKSSEKIKEITGITSTNAVNDLEIELTKGRYYSYYELSNADDDTVLGLYCEIEILPTIPDNISTISVHGINSFEDITDDDYEEIFFGDESSQIDLVLPFKVDKAGGILISLKRAGFYDELTAGIYLDKECTKQVGKKFQLEVIDDLVNIDRVISKKGTYYIKFTYNNAEPNGITTFRVKIYSISGGDRTLSESKTTVAYQTSDKDKIIYKINVKNTQAYEFTINPYENTKDKGAYFRLLDKDKKKLTNSSYVVIQDYDDMDNDAIIKYYMLNKGTYYLEVNANCSIYELQSIALNVKNQAGANKTKAKLLKSNDKAAEGYFTISDKTSKVDWYKFSVAKSSQYINFTIGYILDGDMVFQILDSKGKVLYDSSIKLECKEGYNYNWVGKTYSKGTYYIKVFKSSKNSSFSYGVIINN